MLRLVAAAYLLAEVASLVIVGSWVGVLPTLLLVVAAVLLGASLLRRQGQDALASLRRTLDTGRDPRPALLRGGFGLVAALLLILPGFLGDLVALALLVPAVQRLAARRFSGSAAASRVVMTRTGTFPPRATHAPPPPRDGVVEAEWEEVPPPKRPTHRPSGWTRH